MTREEAARMLTKFADACSKHDLTSKTPYIPAFRMGATALRGPVPDPITGLAPCGCGGQAVFEGSFLDEEVPSSYRVSLSCIECGISTIAYEYEQEATKAWNTAMGWRWKDDTGGSEKSA